MKELFSNFPQTTLKELEKAYLQHVLNSYRGNIMAASKALGVPRATMYRKVAKYKLAR